MTVWGNRRSHATTQRRGGYPDLKTKVFPTETLHSYVNDFFDGLSSVLTNQNYLRDS